MTDQSPASTGPSPCCPHCSKEIAQMSLSILNAKEENQADDLPPFQLMVFACPHCRKILNTLPLEPDMGDDDDGQMY